jgi:lipoprotein-releasing system permease protein
MAAPAHPEVHVPRRGRNAVVASVLVAAGAIGLGVAISRAEGWGRAAVELALGAFGWGTFLEALSGLAAVVWRSGGSGGSPGVPLLIGAGLWLVGWALLAAVIRPSPHGALAATPSQAVGALLYPRLAGYRDFYWNTLLAYGLGILGAELVMLVVHTLLAGSASAGDGEAKGLPPTAAFAIALLTGLGITFVGGFVGASRARRLATPESTVAIIYFGLPVPVLLTLMHSVPALSLNLGYRLREVSYFAGLLGRPETGYWLVFAGLVLSLFFGITSGFVATASGRVDLRTGYELFIANRHVSVFRPGLLLGGFAVLIFGIIPPLLIYAILHAAEAAVERTRIRRLGLADPLEATGALNLVKGREQSPTAMMTALSVGGVGVGVMALIIVLSVMSGFEIDLQSKILGTNSHGVVVKYADSMPEWREVEKKVRAVRGVIGTTPFILNEGMISSENNISGTMIKGVDPASLGSVTDLPKYMLPGGTLEALAEPETIVRPRLDPKGKGALDEKPASPEGEEDELIKLPKEGSSSDEVLPGIVLGREMASTLKVVVGDRVNLVSPLGGELGPQGPMAKSRPFRVAGIFYSGMFEYDSKFVYILLDEAQKFFNVKGAAGVEIKVDDVDNARRITRAIYDKLEGYPYRTKDWGEMNRNLFSALRLEKLVMAIILSIIVIVAAGLIVATVIMLVLEKRKEISVLKALGVPDGGIVKIFLAEGLQIGIAGGFLGLFAGLAWCFFIERVGIKLDPDVYYIPALPVKIEPIQTALAVLIAVLVTFLASIYPALKASQVEPVDGLKSE